MDEPILVSSIVEKGWLTVRTTKVWFFVETNVVCSEVFEKTFLTVQHIIHSYGGTESDRLSAVELLNEFCQGFEESH
jgi:hypothetical protein